MSEIALIGAGGFAHEVLEIAKLNHFKVNDYYAFDDHDEFPLTHRGYLDELIANRHNYLGVSVAFGAVNGKQIKIRAKIIKKLTENGINFISLISPYAVISSGVKIASGAIIAHNVTISVKAVLGNNVILNSAAVIGHDAIIGNNSIISPMVFVGGNCVIAENNLIGAQAGIMQGVQIGHSCSVGMGTSVLRNLKPETTILPNLFKKMKAK
jgi:sugar O-acyltransferase (sialic acid O-acetyltransferase NeuD family)